MITRRTGLKREVDRYAADIPRWRKEISLGFFDARIDNSSNSTWRHLRLGHLREFKVQNKRKGGVIDGGRRGHWVWMCSWFENKLQGATKKASTTCCWKFWEECRRGDRPIAVPQSDENRRKTLTTAAKTWTTTTNPGEAAGRLLNEKKGAWTTNDNLEAEGMFERTI
jgi:hypothetical protein